MSSIDRRRRCVRLHAEDVQIVMESRRFFCPVVWAKLISEVPATDARL
jgi:hypothetical protein